MYSPQTTINRVVNVFVLAGVLSVFSSVATANTGAALPALAAPATPAAAVPAPEPAPGLVAPEPAQSPPVTAHSPHDASAPLDARGAVMKALTGLLVIVAFILGCAFVTKKWLIQPFSSHNCLQVIASLTLGPKEKIAVVHVAGKQLVVGITAYNINVLTELDQPIPMVEPAGSYAGISGRIAGDFAKKLQEFMPKGPHA